ncbi:c-type cytochrome domain-containing protein [Polluticoccus soli]|uniref:c-type cytochrome domain-containing protein n=1 Tax=Polluticoccus soli TaxID=3034150 RepID=UPI0023E0B6A8|nr:c-type cytochrome domain-containing protein [Flavipsychrobacter sp. JY13-12]
MIQRILTAICCLSLTVISCKHEPLIPKQPNGSGYPDEVAKIFVNKCATAGCHNAASYEGAGGLRMDTWEQLFNGGNNGSAIVPYSIEFSPLLYYINTDFNLGIVAQPTMPKDNPPLSKEEYITIRDWVAKGAPDKSGNIPFASDPATRQKIYITMQACDQVAVIDAQKKVVMRYIPVGTSAIAEVPHYLRSTTDGKYAFVSFVAGTTLQKIETSTDKVVEDIQLPTNPSGSWNVFALSPDASKVLVSDWRASGRLVYIDLLTMKMKVYPGFTYPHGIASNPSFDTFYVTSQYGNAMYKLSLDGFVNKQISLDGKTPVVTPDTSSSMLNPHEILMAPDYSKYFITCERSNEVRVLNRSRDSVIKVIPVGAKPQEFAISRKKPYLFVTCMDDQPTKLGDVTFVGSVYVIDYNTLSVVNVIRGNFSSPHGITVDDVNNTVCFASRNVNPTGPKPHHTSSCTGANGSYHVYDMTTFQPADKRRFEVLPDPYSADARFK